MSTVTIRFNPQHCDKQREVDSRGVCTYCNCFHFPRTNTSPWYKYWEQHRHESLDHLKHLDMNEYV